MIASQRFLPFLLALGLGVVVAAGTRADFTVTLGESNNNQSFTQNGHTVTGQTFTYRYYDIHGNLVSSNVSPSGVTLHGGDSYVWSTTSSTTGGVKNYVVAVHETSTGGNPSSITGTNQTSGLPSGYSGAFGDFNLSQFTATSNAPGTNGNTGHGQVQTVSLEGENLSGPVDETLNITTSDTRFTHPNSNGNPTMNLAANLKSDFTGTRTGNFNGNSPHDNVSYYGSLTSPATTGTTTDTSTVNLTQHNYSSSGQTTSTHASRPSQSYALGGVMAVTLAPGNSANPDATTTASLVTPEPASILSILSGLSVLGGGFWLKRRKGATPAC